MYITLVEVLMLVSLIFTIAEYYNNKNNRDK